MHMMQSDDFESARKQARTLLMEGISHIDRNPEDACWRIADALLLLSHEFPDASGISYPTNRGAQLLRPVRLVMNCYGGERKE